MTTMDDLAYQAKMSYAKQQANTITGGQYPPTPRPTLIQQVHKILEQMERASMAQRRIKDRIAGIEPELNGAGLTGRSDPPMIELLESAVRRAVEVADAAEHLDGLV